MERLGLMDADNNQLLATTITVNKSKVSFVDPVIKIIKSPNTHHKMEFMGKIKYNDYEDIIGDLTPNSSIQIEFGMEGNWLLLFYGMIVSFNVVSVPDEYHPLYDIQILGMSYSCLLDCERKCKVYQDTHATHRQIIKDIFSAYPGSNFIIPPAIRDSKLETFTLQYNETDWEFLKRMASRTGSPIVASSKTNGVKIKYGMIWGTTTYVLDDQCMYSMMEIKDISPYKPQSFLGKRQNQYNIEIITEGPDSQSLEIGDCILIQGRAWYVKEVEAIIKDHVLSHKYLLSDQRGFFETRQFNFQLKGLSLPGTVSDVNNNMVKVLFDLKAYPGNNDCWFPYSTFYSTFYCMPEMGDRVNLYIPDYEESHSIILNSVHSDPNAQAGNDAPQNQNFNTQELFSNNQVKILATKDGKMLILDDQTGKVSLVCGDGSYITITGNEIFINTSQEINIHADGTLCLSADESIDLSAETELKISCKDSSIFLSEDSIDINATDIKMNEG